MTLQLIRARQQGGHERWNLVLYDEPGNVHSLGKLQIPYRYASLVLLLLRQGCAVARIRFLTEQLQSAQVP